MTRGNLIHILLIPLSGITIAEVPPSEIHKQFHEVGNYDEAHAIKGLP